MTSEYTLYDIPNDPSQGIVNPIFIHFPVGDHLDFAQWWWSTATGHMWL